MSSRSHRRDKSNEVINLDFRPAKFRRPTIAENLKTGLQKFHGRLRMPSLPKLNQGLDEPNHKLDLQTRSATTVRRRKTLPKEGKSGYNHEAALKSENQKILNSFFSNLLQTPGPGPAPGSGSHQSRSAIVSTESFSKYKSGNIDRATEVVLKDLNRSTALPPITKRQLNSLDSKQASAQSNINRYLEVPHERPLLKASSLQDLNAAIRRDDGTEFDSLLHPLMRFENAREDRSVQPNEDAERVIYNMLKKSENNWDFLRHQLVEAKVRDAFGTYKFYVNGNCLRVLRLLGQGGSAQVFEVFNDDRELLALKVVDLSEIRVRDELVKEIHFLKKLSMCPRVIRMVDYEHKTDTVSGENKLYILMERGDCDLDSVIHKLIKHKSLTPAKLRFYWEEMLEVLKSIHEHNVVHADVKPANFLLVEGRLKMIDFGLAVDIPTGQNSTIRNFVGGTKEYLSPETLSCFVIEDGALKNPKPSGQQNAVIGFKSDVWALGIILYQWMYDGLVPYSELPGGRLAKIAATTNLDRPIEFEPLDDPLVLETLKICLQKDPEQRASIGQLLVHDFLRLPKKNFKDKLLVVQNGENSKD